VDRRLLVTQKSTLQEAKLLLARFDAHASLPERHLLLIELFEWLRSDEALIDSSIQHIRAFLFAINEDEALKQRFVEWWKTINHTVDLTTLLADFGLSPRASFISELMLRLRRKLLPATPETTDAAELFVLTLDGQSDANWLAALDEETLISLASLLSLPSLPPIPSTQSGSVHASNASHWQHELLEAMTYCAGQLRAAGFAPAVRLRWDEQAVQIKPFHALAAETQAFREAYLAQSSDNTQLALAAQQLRERLEQCRQVTSGVYAHLEEHGISVGLVFQLRQMRKRIVRIRELMDCLLSEQPLASTQRLLSRMAALSKEERSVRALIAANSSLVAAKVAERSAETGENYITRDRQEYRNMLAKAAGGGAIISLTTLAKFALLGLGTSVFWTGFFASANYALSFVIIQLLHWTVATKQPAMTAPAMAIKLHDLESAESLSSFVDEVTHLFRSQVAAVIGNLSLVVPCVLGISGLMFLAQGSPMIDQKEALHVLHSISLLGPTLFFAAFTGVLLFASSIIAGWVENWFVLHRLDSAMRYNPAFTKILGAGRAQRWATYWKSHVSGFASNISLGLLLGLVPAFASFFGLGIEVRHVTLSAGQIAAAAACLGYGVLSTPSFWWASAAIPLVATMNLSVSFFLAFRLALLAQNVSSVDRSRIRKAITYRLRKSPLSFLWPDKS
jgi:site-specific recombinase